MTDLIYDIGTVSIAANATTVVGDGGPLWAARLSKYDMLIVEGFGPVPVLGITDDTHLSIAKWPYAAVPAGTAYQVIPGWLRFTSASIAEQVISLTEDLEADGFYIYVKSNEAAPNPRKGNEGQYARKPATGEEWLKINGVWTSQGIVANLSFDENEWSGSKTYQQRVIVPRGGRLWQSRQVGNIGHPPETSPTWWKLFLAGGDAYDVVTFDTDRPATAELVLKLVFTKRVVFYAGLTDGRADADVGATNSAAYSYRRNNVEFATLTFAAGGQSGSQSGSFTSIADTVFVPGDTLTIIAPVTRDPTLSGVGATLSGYRF